MCRCRYVHATATDGGEPAGLIKHGDANIALTKLLARLDKPIVAAVHGYALGAGCGLAFGSDLVVAAESARFGYPELKAGLTASTVTAQAVHLMGRKVAFELLTLCENMLPQRAYELGMVNRVVPDDRLMDEAMAMAEKLAGWNPVSSGADQADLSSGGVAGAGTGAGDGARYRGDDGTVAELNHREKK